MSHSFGCPPGAKITNVNVNVNVNKKKGSGSSGTARAIARAAESQPELASLVNNAVSSFAEALRKA